MAVTDPWIWLPKESCPENQYTNFSAFQDAENGHYTVAGFSKAFTFDKPVVHAHLRFSADTALQLYLNDILIATGPPCVGGDFIGNDTVRGPFYAFETEICPNERTLSFYALVRMMPVQICEYSAGHGGFMLCAELTFSDGAKEEIRTDETWHAQLIPTRCAPNRMDGRKPEAPLLHAESIQDIWHVRTAPIPVRSERAIRPAGCDIVLAPGEKKEAVLIMDMIRAGFVQIDARTRGAVSVHIECRETDEKGSSEDAVFTRDGTYRGFSLHSAGSLLATCENHTDTPASVTVSFIETHYPVLDEAETTVSDEALCDVLSVCKHTLMICRQTHHLDSPRHCEPLACTGDYAIESLMTPFAFGDMRLASFDLIRTAALLERENGRMFHTTYSCIFVRMLWDTYLATGDTDLLVRCEKALGLLLRRFDTYMGANGVIEEPPDYMFIDWIFIDGYSMHHPPKALGQTCLNLFYLDALDAASSIYGALQLPDKSDTCIKKRDMLRTSINDLMYDPHEQAYIQGLNTPTRKSLIGPWMPENTDRRYLLKHANILAACFGACGDVKAKDLIDRIMCGDIPGSCQPYFLHYLLKAVYRAGYRDKYTLKILDRWKQPVAECPKGLVEGFYKPEPGYRFDHSHAWGGAPLWALPTALMGLTILEPGMRALRLAPSLLGLHHAYTELITPYGKVTCRMEAGKKPQITCPDKIRLELQSPGTEKQEDI